jgi:hypothetical protein
LFILKISRKKVKNLTKDSINFDNTGPFYDIIVWDNFHYMNKDETYTIREYFSAEDVLKKCKAIVDSHLENSAKQQGTADEIYRAYTMFGEDPQIIARNGAPGVEFSGWNYAKARAQDYVRKDGGSSDGA